MLENPYLLIGLVSASLILNLITLVLVIVSMKKNKANPAPTIGQGKLETATNTPIETKQPVVEGIVFCRNCGTQFETTHPVCPSCKTAR
ncbi:hypothetical protein R4Z10_18900 [Niallia sp. XMNu-256]|uniref:hypothetical protein n=1 Tax=Niallia sp. XMNu-256 TaxID=3082444 RepID=UPI0030CC2575